MTDSQLIREIKDGNIELYSELMRRYQRKILAFIYHMLKERKAGAAGRGFVLGDVLQSLSQPAFVSGSGCFLLNMAVYDCPQYGA